MKNKLYIIIGSIVIVLAIVAAGIFLIATKDVKPSTSSFNFDGTWRLFNSTATIAEEQYLVFEDSRVNFYKEKDKAYITSDFKYTGGLLELPEANVEFVVNIGTDNCLFLYGPNAVAYTMVRYTGEPFVEQNYNMSLLLGNWDIVLRGKEARENETLVLEGDTMTNDRNGQLVEATFTFEGNTLVINELGSRMVVCRLEEDYAILVEIAPTIGQAYELARSQD